MAAGEVSSQRHHEI